ncbi:hypothetical protein N1027_08805 [Herbiconiux sp. CPCC 205763]|uniref:DUF4190 domain-containing protein n=1 Tax=Herbiconiux aconitum TaxID=2970913 RepID=A0ABT2GPT3_9MICO|nr:hypothetical protein [Herbiconiux aconitum]MCS5718237.1 hypothetical protein [Herbiconiux aconitum]
MSAENSHSVAPVSRFAIVCLVLSLLGASGLGVLLSIGAIVQIRRDGLRGLPIAIAALIISAVSCVVLLVFFNTLRF